MILHWPQLVWIIMASCSIGIVAQKHGQPKRGNESVWVQLISTAIAFWLAYEGGFFAGAQP